MPAETTVFEEPEGDLPEHYAAIGRLVTGFSRIEHALNGVVRTLLGLPEELARAMTGEMRAGDLMATIKRILEAQDRDKIIATSERSRWPSPEALREAIAKQETAGHADGPIWPIMIQLLD
jgi:hypothetical protein